MANRNEIASKIGRALVENYDANKYHPHFNIWGVCYYWNGGNPEWSILLPSILEELKAEDVTIKRPNLFVPKSLDEQRHYSLMTMRNLGIVVQRFMQYASSAPKGTEEIASDKRLTEEAALTFFAQRKQGMQGIDFFDFLLAYQDGEKLNPSLNRQGQFSGLLDRLTIRFEDSQDPITCLGSVLSLDLYQQLRTEHLCALEERKIPLSQSLTEAHAKYFAKSGNHRNSTTQEQLAPPSSACFGKKRVRLAQAGEHFIDWQAYAEQRNASARIYLDPNDVLRQQLVNMVIAELLPVFVTSPQEAYAQIERRMPEANEEEQKALNSARLTFGSMESFNSSERIHHTIKVAKSNE